MIEYHMEGNQPELIALGKAAFPGYNGRSIRLSSAIPSRLDSYWDGGSRAYYSFVNLATMQAVTIPSNHPMYEPNNPRILKELPEGIALIKHTIFCGKDTGLIIYLRPENLTPLLPRAEEVSKEEKIVLEYTASLKNSYGGKTNIRYKEATRETGISQEAWEAAKSSLQAKGMLNSQGTITAKGRNARPGRDEVWSWRNK